MGLWSWITKSDKAVDTALSVGEKVATGLISGIDHLKFTVEEQAEHSLKSSEIVLGFWDRFAKENSDQSKARRNMAEGAWYVYLFLILSCVVVWGFNKEYAGFIFKIIEYMSWIMGAIAATYFAPYQVGKHMWRKKQ